MSKPDWLKKLEADRMGRDRLVKRDMAQISFIDNEGNHVTTDRFLAAIYATEEGRKKGWLNKDKTPYTVTEATIRARFFKTKNGDKNWTDRECVGLDRIKPTKPKIQPRRQALYKSDKRNEMMYQMSRRRLCL